MTLAAIWIRNVGAVEELVVASDSRLTGGKTWDCAPKIVPLSRGDSVICFAGETDYAYPLMMQLRNAVDAYGKAKSRAMSLGTLRNYAVKIFDSMQSYVTDLPAKGTLPDVQFLFGGYCWQTGRFRLHRFFWKKNKKKRIFSHTTHPSFIFAGDNVQDARTQLHALLRSRRPAADDGHRPIDFEPFEIIRDMIRDPQFKSIGGAPQVVKVYKHMNWLPYGVYWPTYASTQRTLLGRPLLDFEIPPYFMLDPDTLLQHEPSGQKVPRRLGRHDKRPAKTPVQR